MSLAMRNLLRDLKDPVKEIGLIREGLKVNVVELFLARENLLVKDVLERLRIPASTYFAKKKHHQPLDAYHTEKFVRLISILELATDILGKEAARHWIYENVTSLGNEVPLNLLDTDIGYRLVEQALLQVKYGMYA